MNAFMKWFARFHAKKLKKSQGRAMNMGGRVILLTTIGAKTGQERDTPLMFVKEGDDYLVAASAAGNPKNPGWFYNLKKAGEATVAPDGKVMKVKATLHTAGDERDTRWAKFEALDKRFVGYQQKTDRTIPVVQLTPQ